MGLPPLGLIGQLAVSLTCPSHAPPAMAAIRTEFGGVIAANGEAARPAAVGGNAARQAAQRYLGLEVPPFLIAPKAAADPGPSGCAFTFAWPPATSGAGRLPSHVLPHELGHAIFIRFLMPNSGRDEYGGDAPDWLDEMAAVAFEDASGVRNRRAEARRQAERGALIPLARLLVMPHPEWAARADADPATGTVAQPRSADTPAFYGTVRALFDFLIERTRNERVIRMLADEARAGLPLDRWILDHAARPSEGLTDLDRDLLAFVLTDPAYAAAAGEAG